MMFDKKCSNKREWVVAESALAAACSMTASTSHQHLSRASSSAQSHTRSQSQVPVVYKLLLSHHYATGPCHPPPVAMSAPCRKFIVNTFVKGNFCGEWQGDEFSPDDCVCMFRGGHACLPQRLGGTAVRRFDRNLPTRKQQNVKSIDAILAAECSNVSVIAGASC